MNSKELKNIWEAYNQVYEQVGIPIPSGKTAKDVLEPLIKSHGGGKVVEPKKPTLQNAHYEPEGFELTEEVEIAAQYFYEMGLNEEGVDILIEDLGVEEFANFVYDIAEEYVLTEARTGGARIEPVTAKGQKFKSGKPTGKSLERLRAQKVARRETEAKASASKPSGMKASLQRQSAVAAAAKKQPKKPGLLDRVAGAVNRGIERHNAAMNAAKETGKTIRKAAGKVGGVAREVGKGASGAARLAGRVASKGLGEEVDLFDYILEHLVSEGYADTNKAALAIMANMSEEWKQSIVDEVLDEEKKEFPSDRVRQQSARHEKSYITRPNSYAGQRSKSKSKKMKAIASTVEVGDDPRNTMHGQDLRKLR